MTGPHRGERERIKVLAGVKVVEIGGMGPGPFAGMMLADHGADVTALRRPDYVRRMYEGRSIFDRGKRAEVVMDRCVCGSAPPCRCHDVNMKVGAGGYRFIPGDVTSAH